MTSEKPTSTRKAERLLRLYDELDGVASSTVLGSWRRIAAFAVVAVFFFSFLGWTLFRLMAPVLLMVGVVVAPRWLWKQYRIGLLRRQIARAELADPSENGR